MLLLLCTALPSRARLIVWRLLGFSVGANAYVAPFTIVVADYIEIGPGAVIGALSLIYRPKILRIGERSRIAGFVRVIGYGGIADFSDQTFVALGCLIDSTTEFRLGARSQLGPRGMFYTHGWNGLMFKTRFPERTGPIVIGKDCWLGMGCIVFPKIRIGNNNLILPGTLVSHSLPDDVAVIPSEKPYRTVPLKDFVRISGLSEKARIEKAREALAHLAAAFSAIEVADSGSDRWVARLPHQRMLVVYPGSDRPDEPLDPLCTVIWILEAPKPSTKAPVFHFGDLTIYGSWTPFAESVADHLCRSFGTHFVFSSRNQAGADGSDI